MFLVVTGCVIVGFTLLNMWCMTMDTLNDVKKSLVNVANALDRVAFYDNEFDNNGSESSVMCQRKST